MRTGYALKWDGDMVLTDAAVAALRDLAWQLEARRADRARAALARSTSRASASRYLDTALRNCEPWAWPNRPGYEFVKALEWELPMFPPGVATLTLPEYGCVELKHLDADEFAPLVARPTSPPRARTARKRRETAGLRRAGRRRASRRRACGRSSRRRGGT